MDAGKLDRRITIRAATVGQDSTYGGVTETWADVATVWAAYLPGGGTEKFATASVVATADCRFRIRWRSDVTPQHRVVFDGREYDVISVAEMGRREGLELHASARV